MISSGRSLSAENFLLPLAVGITGSDQQRTVALTSSERREGVTTIASRLAGALERGLSRSVALIDANMLAPRLHALHGLASNPGLVEVLRGELPLHRALNVAESGTLAVLAAGGSGAGDQGSLLASPRLLTVIEQIRAEGFEFCLIDCPAIAAAPEAALAAAQADAAYLVVRAERTHWDMMRKTTATLIEGGVRLRGTILNRYRAHLPRFLEASA